MFFGHFLKKKQGGWSTPPGFDQISLNLEWSSFGRTPSNWPSFIEIGKMTCAAPAWSYRGCTLKTTSVFCTILIQITVFTFLFFAAAVIITLRTPAGSLRSKSFRPRSSRKLGRKHNKEGGGEKVNVCPETPQFRKMYTQLLIGAVLVVLIKEWLIYQLNQVCFVHLCLR